MSESWKKLLLVVVGSIGIGSLELLMRLFGMSSMAASAGAGVSIGLMPYAFGLRGWRQTLGLMVCLNGLAIPFAELGMRESFLICAVALIIGAPFLWWDELKRVVNEHRFKRSDLARRRHLREVLKSIDSEMANRRDERTRVSQELEALEPKPTYRVADPSDNADDQPQLPVVRESGLVQGGGRGGT